jgi:isoleucyl-tRNA synthetase
LNSFRKPARRDKVIGASLEAAPTLYVEDEGDARLLDEMGLAEIAITSDARIVHGQPPDNAFRLADVPGAGVVFDLAGGTKCARCWMVLPEVGSDANHPDLCKRCADAVGGKERRPVMTSPPPTRGGRRA